MANGKLSATNNFFLSLKKLRHKCAIFYTLTTILILIHMRTQK